MIETEDTQERYRTLGLAEKVVAKAFIEDMATAYAEADLVVARAGALRGLGSLERAPLRRRGDRARDAPSRRLPAYRLASRRRDRLPEPARRQ